MLLTSVARSWWYVKSQIGGAGRIVLEILFNFYKAVSFVAASCELCLHWFPNNVSPLKVKCVEGLAVLLVTLAAKHIHTKIPSIPLTSGLMSLSVVPLLA